MYDVLLRTSHSRMRERRASRTCSLRRQRSTWLVQRFELVSVFSRGIATKAGARTDPGRFRLCLIDCPHPLGLITVTRSQPRVRCSCLFSVSTTPWRGCQLLRRNPDGRSHENEARTYRGHGAGSLPSGGVPSPWLSLKPWRRPQVNVAVQGQTGAQPGKARS